MRKFFEIPVEMNFTALMSVEHYRKVADKGKLRELIIESLIKDNRVLEVMRFSEQITIVELDPVRVYENDPLMEEGWVYPFKVSFKGFTFGVKSYFLAKRKRMSMLIRDTVHTILGITPVIG